MKVTHLLGSVGSLCLFTSCMIGTESGFLPVEPEAQTQSTGNSHTELKWDLHFCRSGDSDSLSIPLLLHVEHTPAPDTLHLSVTSPRRQSSQLVLSKLEVVSAKGQTHDLLAGESKVLSFSSEKPYRAVFESEPRKFEVRKGRKMVVNLEARFQGSRIKLTREFVGDKDGDAEVVPFPYSLMIGTCGG